MLGVVFRFGSEIGNVFVRQSNAFSGGPRPGLYVGEADIGAALLGSGLVLEDRTLVETAI
jgi:hypothetical protein